MIGTYQELEVVKEVDFGVYLEAGEELILLPKKYVPKGTAVGQKVRVFLYTDSEDRPIATTLKPRAALGEIASMKAVDTAKFGAFLDWGLEKDLFVPLKEQRPRMEVGKSYVVKVVMDKQTGRLIGTAKLDDAIKPGFGKLKPGKEVELLVTAVSPLGYTVLIDGERSGMLFKSEVFEPLKTGDKRIGFVKNLRKDGKIDVSLRRKGEKAVADDRTKILEVLKASGGVIPYHYKSDPEALSAAFSMSRKAFKRVLTALREEGVVEVDEKETRLINKDQSGT